MYINVFRQSQCLIRDALLVIIFKWVCDRNDRNDKENGKSSMRRIGRGL